MVPGLKLCYSLFESNPQQILEPYINHAMSLLDKSIGWFPHNTILYQIYLQEDFNGIFQWIKKKKKIENHQLHQSRIQNPSKNPRQRPILKNNEPLNSVYRKLHPRYSPVKNSALKLILSSSQYIQLKSVNVKISSVSVSLRITKVLRLATSHLVGWIEH